MIEILDDIKTWLDQGEEVVLATVVHTWGSSPRGLGARMAFTPGGRIAGSVSWGCVEGQVIESGIQALKNRQSLLLPFGVTDETAFEVGLSCGGKIEVFVKPVERDFFDRVSREIDASRPIAIATVVSGVPKLIGKELLVLDGGEVFGKLGDGLDEKVSGLAQGALSGGGSTNTTVTTADGEEMRLFIDVIAPSPILVIVGGVHIAITLVDLARAVGFRTIVIDPRRSFGNTERFSHVDRLIQSWPQEAFREFNLTRNTCVAILTHDPKIDDPALEIVLRSPVFYVGALGSKKTNESRMKRLADKGLLPAELERLHAPIGMDLGAKSPEEIALSVMAEIVAVKRGRVK
jgi:xanthine dehydrogenase accessory factor